MLENMMKLLGVSSAQAVQPEMAYQCYEDLCSTTSTKRKFICDSNPYYCDVPTGECC